ncbi:unnamed protein product [Albugo candida]|uniref:Uncharacterized protein n=1 Tax=Albugo candida TaxID=65357 RepID=A0A024GNA6_9STRA|nr:unnamed protein product [Albugo candida]|eukprot:CCI48363.1 unnamed protein product [Albugo candida]
MCFTVRFSSKTSFISLTRYHIFDNILLQIIREYSVQTRDTDHTIGHPYIYFAKKSTSAFNTQFSYAQSTRDFSNTNPHTIFTHAEEPASDHHQSLHRNARNAEMFLDNSLLSVAIPRKNG